MRILILILFLFVLKIQAATVTFTMTNSLNQPDTNAIKLQPLQSYANADGSYQTAGLPFWIFPNTNGFVSTNIGYGNWLATNSFIVSQYAGPGQVGTSQGVIFAVPNSSGTYAFGQLAISGYNVYNYNGASFSVSASNIFAAMGFTPLTPQQVTNLFLLSSTNQFFPSNNIVFITNNGQIFISANTQTNGLATTNYVNIITNGLATTNFVNIITNGLSTTNFVTTSITSATNTVAQTNWIISQGYTTTSALNFGTNSVATNSYAQLIATNAALIAQVNTLIGSLSNSMAAATNLLQNSKQPASLTLSNLAGTGAWTNTAILAGTNMLSTTNLITYAVTLNATNQTSLTNPLVQWSGLQPTNYVTQGQLPNLTNQFVTQNQVTGLLTIASAAQTYYPTSNPSGFVSQAVTNGLLSAAAASVLYYPTSNPSSFINAAQSTNFANNLYSNNPAGYLQWPVTNHFDATNTATTVYSNNPSGYVTSTITNNLAFTNWVDVNFDTNGAAFFYWKRSLTNNSTGAVTNYGQWNFANNTIVFGGPGFGNVNLLLWEDADGVYDSILAKDGLNFGAISATSIQANDGSGILNLNVNSNEITGKINVGQIYGAATTNGYVPNTNGIISSATIADQLSFLGNTNIQSSPDIIGVWGGASGNGTYLQLYNGGLPTGIWTNYENTSAAYRIVLSGGNYNLQSNSSTIYFNTTENGQWSLAGGLAPAPHSSTGVRFHCNGVDFGGFFHSTNLTDQITKLIIKLAPIYGGGGGTNSVVIVGGYGITNTIAGVSNTVAVNTNLITTLPYLTNFVNAAVFGSTNGGGISSSTASNLVLNYGGTLFLTYGSGTQLTNQILSMMDTNLADMSGAATNKILGILNGATNGLSLTTVTNIAQQQATAIADNVLMGGVLAGQPTNTIFNSVGTNSIASIATNQNTLVLVTNIAMQFAGAATNAIANTNGVGLNTTLNGVTTLANGNSQIFLFAGANGLIPDMTSYTTPSGTASADSEWLHLGATNYAWHAFSQSTNLTEYWEPDSVPGSHWVMYQFTNTVTVSGASIYGIGLASYTNDVEVSMNGTSWTVVATTNKFGGTNQFVFSPVQCQYIRWTWQPGFLPEVKFAQAYGTGYVVFSNTLPLEIYPSVFVNGTIDATNVTINGQPITTVANSSTNSFGSRIFQKLFVTNAVAPWTLYNGVYDCVPVANYYTNESGGTAFLLCPGTWNVGVGGAATNIPAFIFVTNLNTAVFGVANYAAFTSPIMLSTNYFYPAQPFISVSQYGVNQSSGNFLAAGSGGNLDAGLVTNVQLAALPIQVVTNGVVNAEANLYLNNAGITDQNTRTELDKSITEMKLGGYWTNCISFTTYQSRFNGFYNIIGNPVIWSGTPVQTPYGVNPSGVSTGYVSIPPISGNYTFVAHYRVNQADETYMNLHGNGLAVGLKDTNSASIDGSVIGSGGNPFIFFDTVTNAGAETQKQVYRQVAGGYRSVIPVYQSFVVAYERIGASNAVWMNSVQGSWAQDSATPILTAATNTFPVNQIVIGGDTNFITGIGPASFELDSIMVFNTNLNQTQINSAYSAIERLPYGNDFAIVIGDSRTAENIFQVSGINQFNDWPSVYYSQNPQKQFLNLGLSGQTSRQATNISWGMLTNLPRDKYFNSKLAYAYGINDYYINNAQSSEVISNAILATTPAKNWGARIQAIGPYDVAVSNINWQYSLSNYTNLLQQNMYYETNAFFDDFMPLFWMVTQWDLSTNNPNGFTADGVHFGASTGGTNPVIPARIAALYGNTGKPAASPYTTIPNNINWFTNSASGFVQNDGTNTYWSLNGSALTNLNPANLSGTVPLANLPTQVITNNQTTSVTLGNGLTVGNNSAGNPAITATNLSTASGQNIMNLLSPNLSSGNTFWNFGVKSSTKDWASYSFNYAGDGSANNRMGFAFFGTSDYLDIYADGRIVTTTNSSIFSGISGHVVQSYVSGTNYWVGDIGGGIFTTNHIP